MRTTIMTAIIGVTAMYLLSTLLEYVLPEGGLKSSASKAMGIIVLACVAQSILEVLWIV